VGFREDINKFTNALGIVVKESASQRAMREYGKRAIRLISKRTRNGFGVKKSGAKSTRLAKLRPSTIASRKSSPLLNRGLTSPGKSNLTFTGRLIDSLLVKEVQNGKVVIGADRNRRKGGITNEELASLMEKGSSNRKARPFLNLSSNEIKTLSREFELSFSNALKRRL